MVLGGSGFPRTVAALQAFREIQVVPAQPDYADEISDKQIRAAVQIPSGFESPPSSDSVTPTVRIYNYAGELRSGFMVEVAAKLLSRLLAQSGPRASACRRAAFRKAWSIRFTSRNKTWPRRKK